MIRRNRYYGGNRAHHVDGFDVDLGADSPEEVLDRIEAGKADWGYAKPHAAFDVRPQTISPSTGSTTRASSSTRA